ncbi:hypothetical protein V2A60_010239 [Cordyceps javanica]
MRNRSVWVRVADRHSLPILDVQTRVRYGVESRFGRVEDVNLSARSASMNFIVRFISEDSVSQALAIGGGRIEEKGIKVNISAMFRSKWVLLPSAFHQGNHPGPQESIYRVFKAPAQRRGDLPFAQDFYMGRGSPSLQRTPSDGTFLHNNRSFEQMESRHFGQGGHYHAKKTRFPLNADGNLHGQQPFQAFNTNAQFRGAPIEAMNHPIAAPMPVPVPSAQPETPLQFQPAAKEALGGVEAEVRSAASPQESATGKESTKPRVSLPEMSVVALTIAQAQCLSQDAVHPMISDGHAPARADRSPVRQTKKKRQAAQLRVEAVKSTAVAPGPPLASPVVATCAAEQHTKERQVRRPSLFTADEIRDRKQAWDRIAVPLSSPRKQSLVADDALLSAKRGHDRTQSLPMTALRQPIKFDTGEDAKSVTDAKSIIDVKKEAPESRSVERDGTVGSDAGCPAGEDHGTSAPPVSSPKKSGKQGRKKRNKQDSQSKLPATKEHEL